MRQACGQFRKGVNSNLDSGRCTRYLSQAALNDVVLTFSAWPVRQKLGINLRDLLVEHATVALAANFKHLITRTMSEKTGQPYQAVPYHDLVEVENRARARSETIVSTVAKFCTRIET